MKTDFLENISQASCGYALAMPYIDTELGDGQEVGVAPARVLEQRKRLVGQDVAVVVRLQLPSRRDPVHHVTLQASVGSRCRISRAATQKSNLTIRNCSI